LEHEILWKTLGIAANPLEDESAFERFFEEIKLFLTQ
jgi:hypothetical protein